jgi:flagellar biosynthesis/type III secretory pathway M-ring protein FliF/YscJ
MNKIKDIWNGLSKKGKMFAGALGAILVLIILSYIV